MPQMQQQPQMQQTQLSEIFGADAMKQDTPPPKEDDIYGVEFKSTVSDLKKNNGKGNEKVPAIEITSPSQGGGDGDY